MAERLLSVAEGLIDDGRGGGQLVIAVEQLRADRANGEALATSIAGLRAAIDDVHHPPAGGHP
ncbi:MAG TPA: hypothetical protein VFO97_04820 [Desertimonas sp.]|nr:hypothetical protein [Desertimonas sp.]